MMETESHYFRVGLYIIVLSALLAIFSMWLVSDGIDDSQDYRIYFAESVSGLSVGSPVKYRGVSVGSVKSITIDKKDPRLIRTTISVSGNTPVKVGTVAGLKLQGITGTVYVELSGSEMGAKDLTETVERGKVPIIPSEASSINALITQLPQILDKLSKFADQLAKLGTDENVENFSQALGNLRSLTANLNTLTTGVQGNVIESSEQLSGTMTNLRKASRDISSVTERVEDDPSSLIFAPEEEGIPAP